MRDRVRVFATSHAPTLAHHPDCSLKDRQAAHHPTQDSESRPRWIQLQRGEDAYRDRNHWMQWTTNGEEGRAQAGPTTTDDGWFPPRS